MNRNGPDDWMKGIFLLLARKGDLTECSNYYFSDNTGEKSSALHNPGLQEVNDRSRTTTTTTRWFQKGKTMHTRSNVNICYITEKCRQYNHPLITCFMGYSEVFSTVQHNHLWKILSDMRVPKQFTELITSLYSQQ